MPFGQKAGSLKNLKKNLSKSGGGGKGFIKFIPAGQSLNVRVMTEPEGFLSYASHYDPVAKRSFPCSTETDCPGCKLGLDKKNRYLACVVNLDNNDRVTALELPVSLTNTLVTKYEKWGSITDRDLEFSKQGQGLDTTYDLDYSPQDNKRISKYGEPLDLEQVLQDAYDEYLGNDDEEEEEAPAKKTAKKAPAKKVGGTVKKRSSAAPTPAADEDEEEEEKPKPRKRTKAAPRKAKEPEFEPDDEEDEDDEPEEPEEDEVEEDDDEGYSYEELEAMDLGPLRKIAREEFGVTTKGLNKKQLLDAIMESAEEDD